MIAAVERIIEKRWPGSFWQVAEDHHDETAGDSLRRETWRNIHVALALIAVTVSQLMLWSGLLEQKFIPVVTELDSDGRMSIDYQLSGQPLTPDAARDRALLASYIIARESWHPDFYDAEYSKVLGMSSDVAGDQYKREQSADDSKRATYGAAAQVDIKILSINAWAPDQYRVRFSETVVPIESGRHVPGTRIRSAAIKFGFSSRPTVVKGNDITWQWAGFRVDAIQISEEFNQ